MKKRNLLFSAILVSVGAVQAQNTNTFPETGNVGVGTTTPGTLLDVKGDQSSNWLTTFNNTNAVGHQMYFGYTNAFGQAYGLNIYGGSNSIGSQDFAIWGAGNSSKIIVRGNGKVGIGSEIPNSKLEVKGNDASEWLTTFNNSNTIGHQMYFGYTNAAGNAYGLRIDGGTNNSLSKYLELGINKFVVRGDGNVGIGTASPDKALTLKSNAVLGWEYTTEGSTSYHTITAGGIDPMSFTVGTFSDPAGAIFKFNGNTGTKMTVLNGGYVGIGTTTPTEQFHLYGGNAFLQSTSTTGANVLTLRSEADNGGEYTGLSFDIAGGLHYGAIRSIVGANGYSRLGLFTGDNAGNVLDEKISILSNNGNVGIGTTTPSSNLHVLGATTGQYSLTVENTNTTGNGLLIKAGGAGSNMNLLTIQDNAGGEILKVRGADKTLYVRELEVRLAAFPDYVFEKDYSLMPLSELEAYITKNKHLPNVPSATEVENNGANVGGLLKIQMEKIEELTLYLIEMQKANEKMQKELELLKNK